MVVVLRSVLYMPVLALGLFGCERVVYVYPDVSTPSADAAIADGASLDALGPPVDAWTPPPGACDPYRDPGSVSHSDCRRYADRPVCDVGLDEPNGLGTCVEVPTMFCAPCETDEQCQAGVDIRSECVFLPYQPEVGGSVLNYDDQACLSPCTSDDDCAFLNTTGIWLPMARCTSLPRGTYCTVPFSDGTATCSDFAGGRREDGE